MYGVGEEEKLEARMRQLDAVSFARMRFLRDWNLAATTLDKLSTKFVREAVGCSPRFAAMIKQYKNYVDCDIVIID